MIVLSTATVVLVWIGRNIPNNLSHYQYTPEYINSAANEVVKRGFVVTGDAIMRRHIQLGSEPTAYSIIVVARGYGAGVVVILWSEVMCAGYKANDIRTRGKMYVWYV